MKAIDKFGNAIYPKKFSKLKENGKFLVANGYFESKNKPNLFCKRIPQGWFYADMRGTEEVPIWKDTRPLFYWKLNSETPKWERRRLIKKELVDLFSIGCPCRLSFYAYRSEEFEYTNVFIDENAGIFMWDDGYCRFCGKDCQCESSFCSKECEEKYENALKTPCEVCNNKIDLFKEVRHHISYSPEKVVFVHASCHTKIHITNEFPHLKPSKDEIERFYKK